MAEDHHAAFEIIVRLDGRDVETVMEAIRGAVGCDGSETPCVMEHLAGMHGTLKECRRWLHGPDGDPSVTSAESV